LKVLKFFILKTECSASACPLALRTAGGVDVSWSGILNLDVQAGAFFCLACRKKPGLEREAEWAAGWLSNTTVLHHELSNVNLAFPVIMKAGLSRYEDSSSV
jgi:hypothetical protein